MNVDQLIEKVTTEMEPVLPGLKAKAAGKACTDAKGADATVPSLLDLARIIDHTLLKPDATEEAVRRLCEEAPEHGFASGVREPGQRRPVRVVAGELAGQGVHGDRLPVRGHYLLRQGG